MAVVSEKFKMRPMVMLIVLIIMVATSEIKRSLVQLGAHNF